MSTRDEDSEGSLPSNGTGYRFPIRDRRFENRSEVEEVHADTDDAPEGGNPSDADRAVSVSGGASGVDLSGVRVRSRGAAIVPANRRAPRPQASSPSPAVSPDPGVEDDTPPEEPGVQVIDTPRPSRVSNAAARARNVQLSDRDLRSVDHGEVDRYGLLGMVRTSPAAQRMGTDSRDLAEFDQQFIADARAAFGEGFVPSEQLPGDIGDRIRHIVTMANMYASEFILDQLERMIMSKVPLDTIAARFRVSVPTIWNWRKKLKKRWAEKVQELKGGDIASVIGEHMAKFEVRIAMGMALAQKPNATMQEITKGLDIAERAQTNLIKYQDMLGLHKAAPLAVSADSANQEDVHVKKAKSMTNALADLFGMASGFAVAGDEAATDLEEDDYFSRVAE